MVRFIKIVSILQHVKYLDKIIYIIHIMVTVIQYIFEDL